MDSDAIIALIGAVVLAFLVRFFNVVLQWLAHVLGVDAPEPITGMGHGPTTAALPPRTPVERPEDDSGTSGPPIDTERPPA